MRRFCLGFAAVVLATGAWAADVSRGSRAPDFSLRDLSGQSVKLSSFKGKQNVVLAFWSTTCLISASEMVELQKNVAAFKGKPVTVLGIVSDKLTGAKAAAWAKEHKITLRSVLDADRKVLTAYGIDITPTFLLIDKNGVVQARYAGGGRPIREALVNDVDELLAGSAVPTPTAPTRSTYG